jgi:thiamine monophosphate kinase
MGIAARDAVRAGDDYELCFTSSARAVPEVRARAAALGIDVAEIGELVPGSGVLLDDAPVGAGAGYEHF